MSNDRVVVVTGAAGGIGGGLVDRFLANGDTVIGIDIKRTNLAELRGRARFTEKLITIHGDVSDEASCIQFAGQIGKEAGQVDVLVNCAGYYPIRPFEEMSLRE